MTPQEMRQAVSSWLRIRAETGYAAANPATSAEADHSALLGRLLEGKEPFPTPPPTAFSYPWYDLLEQPYQEWIMMDPWLGERKEAGTIVFQQSRWQILETLPDGWRVSHERLPGRVWRLTKKQIMTNTVNGPREFPGWHLEEERA